MLNGGEWAGVDGPIAVYLLLKGKHLLIVPRTEAADSGDELGRLAIAFNRMAASLEHQIGALVAARDRERRFVADVSHELRTPLTALVNEAARLSTRLDDLPASDRPVGVPTGRRRKTAASG